METSTKKLNWVTTLFFTLTPIVAVLGTVYVVFAHGLHFSTIILALIYTLATGLAITAGYHRLFSHLTYKAAWPIRLFYALLGAAAFEGSILEWCTDHRNHHRYTDQEKDPYSVKKGLWHAHMGWILYLDDSKRNFNNVEDLAKDPIVQWQQKYYLPLSIFMSFLLPALIAACWGDMLGGFFIAGFLRLVINHHFTFCINSLCHFFGKKTYAESTARDNWLMSLVTYGEGFHNFHHQFAADYRNGVRWYHFDPAKWTIWTLAKLNLATGLKRVDKEFIIKHRLQMEEQRLRSIKGVCPNRLETLLKPISDRVHQLHLQSVKLRKEYSAYKQAKVVNNEHKCQKKHYKQQLHHCRREFKHTVKAWMHAKKNLLQNSLKV